MAQRAAEPGISLKTRVTLRPHCRRRTDCHELSVDLHRCAMASIHSKYACTRTPPPPKTSSLQHKINQRLGVYQELELGLVVEFLPTVWAQGPEFVTKHLKTTSFSNKLK